MKFEKMLLTEFLAQCFC